MATFFGEVLPVFSRAVDEDDEEDEDEISPSIIKEIVLKWDQKASKEIDKSGDRLRLKCKLLVVAVGPIACGFVRTCILPPKNSLLGTFTYEDRPRQHIEDLPRRSKVVVAGEIHGSSSSKGVVFCLNEDALPSESTYDFTQQLFSSVPLSQIQVAILYSRHVAEYLSSIAASSLTTPFLRSLKSSAYTDATACSCLEQPNTVSGLPAAILTHCQVNHIPAVMYISHTDLMDVDSVNMFVFRPLLKFTPFHNVVKENPNVDKSLMAVGPVKKDHGNLYL